MKNRLILWGTALSLATIATAASFSLPVVQGNTDPNKGAKELGVDPHELKESTRMARQLGSDLRYGRPAKETEVAHLVEVTKKGGALAGEIYWNLMPIRKKAYRAKFVEQAAQSGNSRNENEVFSAVHLLKFWNDSRWETIAKRHVWQSKGLEELALEPRYGDSLS